MIKIKLMMAVAAAAMMAATSGALTQQESPRNAPAEKMAPKTPIGETDQNSVPKGTPTINGETESNRNVATAPPGGANITSENRTRIREVFVKEGSAPRVDHVDFGLWIGTSVPRSVRIVAIPQTIIELQPTWRGYEYFMVGDEIVVVDPRSMQIAAVFNV
jgi:Protein of unknown function (DUF1236)